MFSLFPMVDQLSGAPLFDDNHQIVEEAKLPEADKEEPENDDEGANQAKQMQEATKEDSTPDDLISTTIAKQQALDRERYASEFFDRNEHLSELLRNAVRVEPVEEQTNSGTTLSERVELGQKIMKLTKSLTFSMEDIDKGKDLRSFKTWSTNFSLRSGASARRRSMLDNVSLRSHRTHDADASEDESVASGGSGTLDDVDGDALLLGLAAHDGIWRKQVVDALKESIDEMENGSDVDEDEVEDEAEPVEDMDTALTKELGNFLFGENMSKIITKKKKSHALPPEEITTVLFDLTTNIATSAPDEITVFGKTSNNMSIQSSFGGTAGKRKAAVRADMLLANMFILHEALPVWLKSFRPFQLDQRRVLWPRMRQNSSGSLGGSGTQGSDGDSLTIESTGSAPKSPSRTKELREIIEDQELDVETRAET
jgi:hypothetical protein